MPSNNSNRGPWLLVAVLILLGAAVSWNLFLQRNLTPIQSFVASMGDGDYAAASELLAPSSSIRPEPGGGLSIRDRTGKVVIVDASLLPFLVSSEQGAPSTPGPATPTEDLGRALDRAEEADFVMVGLGEAVDGNLLLPAVVLHLEVVDGQVHIKSIEP